MPTLTRTEVEVRSSHLRAFSLPTHGVTSRVALVPEQAVLLAGDHVEVTVRVGAGRTLELVEPGGTVAYGMRGQRARWDVTIEVDAGASLVWDGEPFVVAEGADVARSVALDVAAGSRVVLRETIVLGRIGEEPGSLVTRADVRREGVPVLVEELDSALGFGPNRILDQVLLLGGVCAADADTLTLQSGDLIHRWLGQALHQSPVRIPPQSLDRQLRCQAVG